MEQQTPQTEPPRTELRPPSKAPWVVLAAALVAAVALLVWLRHRAAPPAPQVAESPAPAVGPNEPATPPRALPAAPSLAAVSTHPLFRRGVEEGDVERRWAVITDNLAEGVSPRKQLEFLAPSRPFAVVERAGRTVIAPESYHRYDAFADAVASVDVPMLIAVYRQLHGAIEAAYRKLGYPGASLDAVTVRALRRLVAAPVRDVEVPVQKSGGAWEFADPALEELGAVEKHLLRMGPRNVRIIQGKAREILQQLGSVRVEPKPAR